jgi:protein TonB
VRTFLIWAAGILAAVVLHGLFLCFGGLIFPSAKPRLGTTQQVELLSDVDAEAEKKDEKKDPEKKDPDEPIDPDQDKPPDAAEIDRALDAPPTDAAPALEAASLSAISDALEGKGSGGGEFGDALSFASGGRIGGTGKAGALDDKSESAFSMGEIDQKPRPIIQGQPLYPSEMRGKKVDGSVTALFVVGTDGKVQSPKVAKSSHPAFEQPALDALKQWKFEPGVKGGQRVACKMRVTITFKQNSSP